MARIVGSQGRVIAFEPGPDTAQELRAKARAEGLLPQISLHELALGDQDGSHVLRADPDHPDDSTKRSLFIDGPSVGEVSVRSFDGLVDAGVLALPHGIQAVKIDVEGAEMSVLAGMRRALEAHQPRLIVAETIEGHLRRAGSAVSDVHGFMRSLNYVAFSDAGAARPLELNAVFVPRPSTG
jgi:FkbM family methyltransferase